MLKQLIYAIVGFFCVIIGFYFVVPAWNLTANGLSNAANNGLIPNAGYLNSVNTIGTDLNLLVGYSFLAMGVGIWLYLLLFAWRRQTITDEFIDTFVFFAVGPFGWLAGGVFLLLVRGNAPHAGKIKCPGCGQWKSQLDVFHVRDCTSKQARLTQYA